MDKRVVSTARESKVAVVTDTVAWPLTPLEAAVT